MATTIYVLKSHWFQSVNTVAKRNVPGQITNGKNDSPTRGPEMSSINTSGLVDLETNSDTKWKSTGPKLYVEYISILNDNLN